MQSAPLCGAKLAAVIAVVAVYLGVTAAAQAAPVYVFNAERSLTGDCSTSLLDEVPDPGCPDPPHPPQHFENPSVATDSFGDLYVASVVKEKGRVDVFDSKGFFITELKIPEPEPVGSLGPQSLAIDSKGNLYVFEVAQLAEKKVVKRFPPSVYEPLKGKIEYALPSVVVVDTKTKPVIPLAFVTALAVDTKDRLYIDHGQAVSVFKSAEEGNALLEPEPGEQNIISGLSRSSSIAVDSKHERIYLSDSVPGSSVVRIFEEEAPYKELGKIDGKAVPSPPGEFLSGEGKIKLGVHEATGGVFVSDTVSSKKVYEFGYEEDGEGKVTYPYAVTIEHGFNSPVEEAGEISVDNGSSSPNTGYLYIPSEPTGTGHAYAFEPKEEEKPEVESTAVADVTETDAVLKARINPHGLPTEYRLAYISLQLYEEEDESFTNAAIAGEGTLPKGGEGVTVSAPATALEPGTVYLFHVVAENAKGEDEAEKAFKTFEERIVSPGDCPNEARRLGTSSAPLPDCRAYELVSPPDTNGHAPAGTGFTGVYFPSLEASPDGNRASFYVEGGLVPGQNGAGAFNGDPYLATRDTDGWSSEVTGPSGEETIGPNPGSFSPDQGFSLWENIELPAIYIRFPDGHSELVGEGSLGEDPKAKPSLVTENAAHIVFESSAQLEPNAPPAGFAAVYDRSAEGPTHVVSLLPGSETPKSGAQYLGASEEGEGIAFSIAGSIYLRLHNEETFKVAGPGSTFAGVAKEGTRVFYLEGGDLFAYDAAKEEAIEFTSSGDVIPVNVASGGTRAYFVSLSVLTSELNPNEEEAELGAENLYLSEEGQISFVGIVTERDVEGEERTDGRVGGLGLWIEGINKRGPAKDPSRATPSGTTLLFESRSDLTDFESDGFAQVYRYDMTEGRLDCLSCSPTNTPPTSDANLQSVADQLGSFVPTSQFARIPNQSPDGKRAFFQTAEPLVIGDTDELLDVYEWEEAGVGGCKKEGGCTYLISGGHSSSPDFLFAMSSSGDDVFFRTADILLPRDAESTLSIYDARVNGGFTEESNPQPCEEGEICKGSPTSPPTLPVPAKAGDEPATPLTKPCPKGKHKAKRQGKSVCVKNHHKKKHRHHRGASSKNGGAK